MGWLLLREGREEGGRRIQEGKSIGENGGGGGGGGESMEDSKGDRRM